MEGLVLLDQLEGGPAMAVLLMEAIGSSTGREENHDLVNGLRILGEKIPEYVMVSQVGLGISLGSVDQVSILAGVPDKENRCIEEDPVQYALLGLQFDSKAMGITGSICRARFARNCGETDRGVNLLSDLVKKGLRRNVAQVMSNFEVTVSASTLGMDDTLGNALATKVCEDIEGMEVLDKEGAIGTCTLGSVGEVDWRTIGSGIIWGG